MSLTDRILGSFDKLAASAQTRERLPDPRYLAVWSYSVTSADVSTFSGRALSSRCPQPDLPKVPNMPGLPGALLRPAVGSIVGVAFLDGDPAQPRCVWWDQTVPVSLSLPASQTVATDAGTSVTIGESLTRVLVTAALVAIGDGTPSPQAVALAPAVTTFANASVTLANVGTTSFTLIATAFTTLAAQPAIVGAAAACTAAAGAATALATASSTFASSVGALVGPFPTGFTATKLSTQ